MIEQPDVQFIKHDMLAWIILIAGALFLSTIVRYSMPKNAEARKAADAILLVAAVWVGLRAFLARRDMTRE